MPNHVKNVITLYGDAEKIQQMLEKIKNDEYGIGTIDFNKMIPMPENIYTGNLGQRERMLYGENNWYDWSVRNWNTKWNAYDYGTDYSKSGKLEFLTAWSAPHPVIERLAGMFPEIKFTHEWADEDIGMNCGRRIYSGGEQIGEYHPDYSHESAEFALSVWDGGTEENEEESMNFGQSAT